MPYDIGSGLASFGNDIADAMQEYHKKHEAYNQAEGVANALSRLGIDEQGNITPVTGPDGKPLKNITPILDPKAVEMFKSRVGNDRSRAQGALEALSRIGLGTASKAISQRLEDASVSGQRTKQIMAQDTEMFPLEVAAKKASTAHIEEVTKQSKEQSGKIYVQGFGYMTPSQASAHAARQERLKILEQKSEPLRNFENQLQNAYGLGMQDVISATKGKFKGGKDEKGNVPEYTGVPFVDATGAQVTVDTEAGKFKRPDGTEIPYDARAPSVWAKVGSSGTLIPAHLWPSIVAKSKNFSTKLESLQADQAQLQQQNNQLSAQKIISANKGVDPSTLSDYDKQALEWAKKQLGQ